MNVAANPRTLSCISVLASPASMTAQTDKPDLPLGEAYELPHI
ncbi:hypothetical protein P775_08915 [Puniceibacterium antarcticum]|uniref:Uncharacterized protein n=1 Tax=Puniceibacterium antarcticum TaxID=1206336 RepID=A0A2G8RGE3_9RHOB|nr:hypothetical protein P775_08915 [Puniceibacterium antarcticum]